MKEQERKYLLKYLPDGLTKQKITQGYLMLEGNKNLRVRIVNDSICYLTFKTFHSDEIRTEYEYQIPLNDGIEMMKSTKIKVNKTRYKTTHNNLNVDIDIYEDGKSIVEIEFDNELGSLPDYFGDDITGNIEYSNILMSLINSENN
jgi:CYTH domain-containing protein